MMSSNMSPNANVIVRRHVQNMHMKHNCNALKKFCGEQFLFLKKPVKFLGFSFNVMGRDDIVDLVRES